MKCIWYRDSNSLRSTTYCKSREAQVNTTLQAFSQISNHALVPRNNQNRTWQKEDCSGRNKSAHCSLEFLHFTFKHYWVKSMRQFWEQRWDPTPPFLSSSGNSSAQCIVKSNSSFFHSLAKVIQVLLNNRRGRVSIPHFQSFAPTRNSRGLHLELLLFLLVLQATDIVSVTTIFCCMVLDGSVQLSIYHPGASNSIPA